MILVYFVDTNLLRNISENDQLYSVKLCLIVTHLCIWVVNGINLRKHIFLLS
jgi:hypothetical protein